MDKNLLQKIEDGDPLKITIVTPLYEDDKDNYLNFDFISDWDPEIRFITNNDIPDTIRSFKENGYDALINLCDAYEHPVYPGLNFLTLLEKENIVFTGTSSVNYGMTKTDIKKFTNYSPGHVLVTRPEITEDQFESLQFPLIVKPNLGGGSAGIDDHSKVNDFTELETECRLKLPRFKELVVEEFIEGREFTSLVVENDLDHDKPICLDPVECIFRNKTGFKSEKIKWAEDDFYYEVLRDPELTGNIRSMCEEAFSFFKLDGYVRIDIRATVNNRLFITDINPYCAIFSDESSSDFILDSNKHIFKNNRQLLLHLIRCGYKRYLRKR